MNYDPTDRPEPEDDPERAKAYDALAALVVAIAK